MWTIVFETPQKFDVERVGQIPKQYRMSNESMQRKIYFPRRWTVMKTLYVENSKP